MSNYRIIIIMTLALVGTNTLLADSFHYKNTIIGDRSRGMAGAYVAVSDDGSGSYYNPAGLAWSIGESLSGTGQVPINTSTTTYEKAKYDQDWTRSSEGSVVNFIGITKKLKRATLAFSMVLPESFIEHQDQTFKSPNNAVVTDSQPLYYYISNHTEQSANWYGLSLAYPFEKWSIGTTVYYASKSTQQTKTTYGGSQEFYTNDNYTEIYYESGMYKETAIVTKFGIQSNHLEPFTIGVAYTDFIGASKTTERYDADLIGYYAQDRSVATTSLTKTERETELLKPQQLSFGIAFYPTHDFLFALDLDHFKARDPALLDVLNYSFGAEWFYSAEVALLGGYFTNFDNRPEPTLASSAGSEKMDLTGFTGGFTYLTETTTYTVGIVYASGIGMTKLNQNSSSLTNSKRTDFSIFYATNVLY